MAMTAAEIRRAVLIAQIAMCELRQELGNNAVITEKQGFDRIAEIEKRLEKQTNEKEEPTIE